jgi:hypothetical protein
MRLAGTPPRIQPRSRVAGEGEASMRIARCVVILQMLVVVKEKKMFIRLSLLGGERGGARRGEIRNSRRLIFLVFCGMFLCSHPTAVAMSTFFVG